VIFNRLFITLFLILPFCANAQKIKVIGPEGEAVQGAFVFVVHKNQKSDVYISDKQGVALIKSVQDTVSLLIRHTSYREYLDSGLVIRDNITIKLVKKDVALDQVVITGEYAPRDVNTSVQPVTVISGEKVENLSAQNLEQVMATQLNVRMTQDPALGASMSINGLSGQNIKFLVDGVPVTGRLDGNIDPSQLNMNNVERVEIIEGPMSVAYGTDAAGGVINIITKKPGSKKVEAGANLLYETRGQYNLDGYGGLSLGKSSFLVSGGRNFFDGWSETDTSRWQLWKPKEQYFGDIKYRINLKNLLLGYQLSAFHETITDKGEPRVSPYAAYAFDTYYKTLRFVNQVNAAWLITPDRSLSGTLSRSDYKRIKNTYRKDLVELQQQLIPGGEEQDTTSFVTYAFRSTYNKFKEGDAWNFQGGTDITHETAAGSRFTDSKESIGDYALFGSAEYTASKKVVIRPAMRMTYNTHFKAPVIPSFSIRYNPKESLAIRFSYGKGFRAPGVKELYLYFVDINHNVQGNEKLLPEYSDNFYLSAAQQYKAGALTNMIKFSAFQSSIRDMITLAQPNPASSLYTYVNIGKFSTHGGSVENTASWKSFALTTGVAITGRYNLYADSGDFKKYIYSPDAFVSLENQFKSAGLWAGIYLKYNGPLPGYKIESDNTITQFTNQGYTFLDASIRKALLKNTLFFTVGLKNILDVTSINGSGQASAHTSGDNELAVGTGRSAFIKLQYKLK